ncbi:MAG: single-stranded DNA-binding protein [Campylobacterota bacterium]|nr:single-stranded DNA-binding protein [Campylobacterota bacterium]
MFNKVVLVGNLTRDIELRYSQSGIAIANTAIATSRKFTSNGEKKEEVCFVDITFFARSAEVANQYLRKGSKILVEGRLKFDQWVDNNNQKRSKHSVTVETMQMLDSKGDNMGGQQAQQGGYEQQNAYGNTPAPEQNYSQAPTSNQYQQNSYGNQQQPPVQQQPQYEQQQAPKVNAMPQNSMPEIDIDDDEIPF